MTDAAAGSAEGGAEKDAPVRGREAGGASLKAAVVAVRTAERGSATALDGEGPLGGGAAEAGQNRLAGGWSRDGPAGCIMAA